MIVTRVLYTLLHKPGALQAITANQPVRDPPKSPRMLNHASKCRATKMARPRLLVRPSRDIRRKVMVAMLSLSDVNRSPGEELNSGQGGPPPTTPGVEHLRKRLIPATCTMSSPQPAENLLGVLYSSMVQTTAFEARASKRIFLWAAACPVMFEQAPFPNSKNF